MVAECVYYGQWKQQAICTVMVNKNMVNTHNIMFIGKRKYCGCATATIPVQICLFLRTGRYAGQEYLPFFP